MRTVLGTLSAPPVEQLIERQRVRGLVNYLLPDLVCAAPVDLHGARAMRINRQTHRKTNTLVHSPWGHPVVDPCNSIGVPRLWNGILDSLLNNPVRATPVELHGARAMRFTRCYLVNNPLKCLLQTKPVWPGEIHIA